MPKSITVYSKPACVQCDLTKNYLDTRGIEYLTIDVSSSDNSMDLEAIKALGYMGAPVVIVNDDENVLDEKHWYGFRPDMLAEFCTPKEG